MPVDLAHYDYLFLGQRASSSDGVVGRVSEADRVKI
jgi:hypothetical protein